MLLLIFQIILIHKLNLKNAGHKFQLPLDRHRLLIRQVRNHHVTGSVCNKLFLHQIQTLLCLCRIRKIVGHGIFHVNPVSRHGGKNNQDAKQ